MLGFTPPSFVAMCAPLGVLVAHRIATWRRPDFWQLTAPRLGLCLSAAGWGVCGAVFGAISVAIDAAFRLPSLKNALYYHADYVNPGWKKPKIEKIGHHIFYGEKT